MWETRIEIFLPDTKPIHLLYSSQNSFSRNKGLTWVQQICGSCVSSDDPEFYPADAFFLAIPSFLELFQ